MGSPDNEEGRWDDEGPRCQVTLTEGFWLADTPCTQALWEEVMGQNPSRFKAPRHPVEQVSWEDVQVFLRRLEERIPIAGAQLPTEAQWEFACRAGTETSTYAPTMELGEIAWYLENSGGSAQDVGLKKPNGWGLYDILGNVWEWCGDWFSSYDGSTKHDPTGPLKGSFRVIRGGSWLNVAGDVRAASRYWNAPGVRNDVDLGFRFSLGRPRSG
jgi:formylglycine-generating enzyme required for sulfatase activity